MKSDKTLQSVPRARLPLLLGEEFKELLRNQPYQTHKQAMEQAAALKAARQKLSDRRKHSLLDGFTDLRE